MIPCVHSPRYIHLECVSTPNPCRCPPDHSPAYTLPVHDPTTYGNQQQQLITDTSLCHMHCITPSYMTIIFGKSHNHQFTACHQDFFPQTKQDPELSFKTYRPKRTRLFIQATYVKPRHKHIKSRGLGFDDCNQVDTWFYLNVVE